ncbi:MAG TPA: VIT1/CCC1 transporter family protein [Thermoplasmata archaeon]|nr:VIT1/CCC1 transporter family protein [Thermoplasmata archaeon]
MPRVVTSTSSPVSGLDGLPAPAAALPGEKAAVERVEQLEDTVFGVLDGVVTSLAIAVSVAAVVRPPSTYDVFLTVIAAAFAGAVSMFVGAVLSARARQALIRRERARELRSIEQQPAAARAELLTSFEAQGFPQAEAELLTARVTANTARWVDRIMRDELHLVEGEQHEPLRHGAIIGFMYLVGGALPALPFLFAGFPMLRALTLSLAVGGLEFVTVGTLQAHYAGTNRLWGAIEVLLIGLGTALVVFLITSALQPA